VAQLPSKPLPVAAAPKKAGGDLLDLLDDEVVPAPSPAMASTSVSAAPSNAAAVKKVQVVTPEAGQGVFISVAMVKNPTSGQVTLEMDIGNTTSTPVQALAIQLNKNAFGLAPQSPQILLSRPVSNGSSVSFSLPLILNPQMVNPQMRRLICSLL